jgi:hypothetical protein
MRPSDDFAFRFENGLQEKKSLLSKKKLERCILTPKRRQSLNFIFGRSQSFFREQGDKIGPIFAILGNSLLAPA